MSARFARYTPSRMDRAQFIATFGGIYEHYEINAIARLRLNDL